jgi:hypothetical protein
MENFRLADEIANLITKSQKQLSTLRGIRKQLKTWVEFLDQGADSTAIKQATKIIEQAKELEDSIYQDQIETSQDEINYRRLLTNHLIRLYRVVIDQNNRPSQGELERWVDLKKDYENFEMNYQNFLQQEMPAINVMSR